jgi:hypothetical protein
MVIAEEPVCPRHDGDVRLGLRTLHSDEAAPEQILGTFVCPECGHERRLPIETGVSDQGEPRQ